MSAYYNEFKPEAAHMLRQLIKDGRIAPGDVDERSITEVKADDIKKYTQCHFFAGIGLWSVALRLAGWGDDRAVWTGSCPCQPFSSAGRQKGKADERHLWPVWFRLIRECRPATVFGEQVESAIAHGWLDDVYDDMEGQGYAVGAAVLPACAVGKPHQRKRLWFVAHRNGGSAAGWVLGKTGECGENFTGQQNSGEREPDASAAGGFDSSSSTLGNAESQQVVAAESGGLHAEPCGTGRGESSDVADAECGGRSRQGAVGESLHPAAGGNGQASKSLDDSAGERIEWLQCPDGKSRPVKSGVLLLAHGYKHRTPILHAIGNGIVPSVAAEFIKDSS